MTVDVVGQLVDNRGAILVGVSVFLGSWLLIKKLRHRNRKSPPGLPSIPILGSLPWLPSDANHLTFTALAKKYGNIYSIDFGSQHAVVLNDLSSIEDAFIKQAVIFADRPAYYTTKEINPGQKGIVDAFFTETYTRNKQTSLAVLRDLGFGKNVMEERIMVELTELIERFGEHKAQPFDPGQLLYVSVSNIICSILFNKRFNYDDSRFCTALAKVREMLTLYGDLMIYEFLPWINYLPVAKRHNDLVKAKYNEVVEFIKEELREHSKSSDPNDLDSDFILAYKHKMAGDLDLEALQFIVMDFFAAGSDTTSTTLRWALIYMANNPDVQARVQLEIDDVIGQSRPPCLSDRSSLRFTEAVILETLRRSSIAATALPHRLSEDTELQGYFLEKGTLVNINIWAVHHDPIVWPDPERYDAERFLDDQGHVTGRERIIPFGLGRRSCLGESLARQELFLYFTSILQRFQVLPPPGQQKLPEEGIFGTVLYPKPHQVILKLR